MAASSEQMSLFVGCEADDVMAYCEGEAVSFAAFVRDVAILTQSVSSLNGDVLICCKNRYAFSVALLAAWQSGKVAILPPNQHAETLGNIAKLHDISFRCDDVWAKDCRQDESGISSNNMAFTFAPNQWAVRLYTSGSTGQPKAIEKSISNLLAEVAMLKDAMPWARTPIVASVPPHHLYGLTFSVLLPWVLGVPLVDDMPLHADEVACCLQQYEAQTLMTVPIHLKALMDADVDLTAVMCVASAAPLSHDIAQLYRKKYGGDALEVYGSSETGVIAWRKQIKDQAWQAFSGVSVSSGDDDLLQVSSPFVEGSGEKEFAMSDQVRMGDDSRFILEGRVDSIVKIGGKRISTITIEQCLMRCEGVKDAAVVVMPAKSHIRDLEVWAVVVMDENVQVNSRHMKRQLQAWLDGVVIPRRIITISELPREANGKLPKKRLLELFT